MAVTINGTTGIDTPSLTADTTTLVVDETNNRVGIGTSSPESPLNVYHATENNIATLHSGDANCFISFRDNTTTGDGYVFVGAEGNNLKLGANAGTKATITSSGGVYVSKTVNDGDIEGIQLNETGSVFATADALYPLFLHRLTNDGNLVILRQGGTTEGTISVSGSTVSYNGGHLARWSRLADDSKDTSIVKGTVMTNLDAMVEWGDEDNEQLNKMAVSSVEGDANVAGVFVNWDEDDDWNDINIAMTGDMVIRIASGTTVARGDLLMSAGDGTAKPQGDDIVRSKTIAKVTSTNVSHTYDDGSYLVPCVLMAC